MDRESWSVHASLIAVMVAASLLVRRRRRKGEDGGNCARKCSTSEGDDRYAKQRMVLGYDGQSCIETGSVLVIGCGGLASGCLPLLTGGGVACIGLVDDDVVDVTNLHRQTIHTTDGVGTPKVASAAKFVKQLNPAVKLMTFHERVTCIERLQDIAQQFTCIVDCSDNLETRYLINSACVALRKPLVSASALGTFGQLAVYWPDRFPDSGCYECAFARTASTLIEHGTCSSDGVLGPLPSILGAFQALEVLKVLAFGGLSTGARPLIGDASGNRFQFGEVLTCFDLESLHRDPFVTIKLRKKANCPCCSMTKATPHIAKEYDVKEITRLQDNYIVVDVRPMEDRPLNHEHSRVTVLRMSMQELRRDPVGKSQEILARAGEGNQICFVCRQGLQSRVAASIVAFQTGRRGLMTLQGGVGE